MTDDDFSPTHSRRRDVSLTISVGDSQRSVPGEMNFISGEVTVELSGAAEEGADTLELSEAIEQAVHDAVEDFEATAYANANDH